MLGILKAIGYLAGAVAVLGLVLGGLAFFAAIGAAFIAVLVGGALLVLVAVALCEFVESFFKRRRKPN